MSDIDVINNKISLPNNSMSIIFFLITTLLYGYFNYNNSKIPLEENIYKIISDNYISYNYSSKHYTNIIIYILLLIVGNYFININISKELCQNVQWFSTFIITLLPWILIFFSIIIIILIFPGWLAPFSNTIGYFIANLNGLNDLMNKILISQAEIESKKSLTNDNRLVQYNLTKIYGDQSLLINEITNDNFKNFIDNLIKGHLISEEIIKKEIDSVATDSATTDSTTTDSATTDYDPDSQPTFLLTELFNLIILKNNIAEIIWYILTGLLVTSIIYNYLVNNECKRSIKQMQNRHKNYLTLQEEINNKKKNITKYDIN